MIHAIRLSVLLLLLAAPLAAIDEAGLVKRGKPLGSSRAVPVSELLRDPRAYEKRPVTVEGVVERVCTNKGCWMEIAPAAGEGGVRVTFKDYGFFVPKDAKGMKVRAEGEVTVKTLSRERADHYESEGGRVRRNPDGTADEVTFVAAGVELRPGAALKRKL